VQPEAAKPLAVLTQKKNKGPTATTQQKGLIFYDNSGHETTVSAHFY
jgi:hypothetical protein